MSDPSASLCQQSRSARECPICGRSLRKMVEGWLYRWCSTRHCAYREVRRDG